MINTSIPPVVKNLLIINVLFYFLKSVTVGNNPWLSDALNLYFWGSEPSAPWQWVTHMFMHADVHHLFSNMLGLFFFGPAIESALGSKRFLNFYMICGLGAALCQMLSYEYDFQSAAAPYLESGQYDLSELRGPYVRSMLGASGAVFGVLFAFAYLFPNEKILMLFFPFPIKAKYLIGAYAVFEFFAMYGYIEGDNIAHLAHLGGMLFGFLLLWFWRKNGTINTTFYERWD